MAVVLTISAPVFFVFVFLLFSWLGFLSFLLFRAVAGYNRLTEGLTDKTLSQVLNSLLEEQTATQQERKRFLTEVKKLQEQGKHSIQKIGLIRFNPFSDIGGDQSFVIALLDDDLNGLVMTALYARTGVRWYVKTIHGGKAGKYALSQEEEEAIKKAAKL